MLKAIAASKKKNDRVDARKIADLLRCDLLRCDLLPDCYVAPSWMRELRRVLRYRNLVVRKRPESYYQTRKLAQGSQFAFLSR